MSAPTQFLTSLAQSLSTLMLYPNTHPAWARAVDASHARLVELQRTDPSPRFSFLEHEVVYGTVPLRDLRAWPWAARLAAVGIQRLEFAAPVQRDEFERFLVEALARIVNAGVGTQSADGGKDRGIRFGAVVMHDERGAVFDADGSKDPAAPVLQGIDFGLAEEVNAVRWLQKTVETSDALPIVEADAVVRSLTVAMRGMSAMLVPLLRLKASDPYNAIHSINVAVLSMALGDFLGFGRRDVHGLGMAALLHDIGMARVPKELLTKSERLADTERARVEQHTVDGARIILASARRLDLAALVAYEHHLRPDGSGYPARTPLRPPHRASQLVRVCSVYNALRIARAHRAALSAEQALAFLESRAGADFDAELTTGFLGMIRRMDTRVAEFDSNDPLRTPLGVPTIDRALEHY